MERKTRVDFDGERTLINGEPTYPGRTYEGSSIEGLLLNARLVQAIFDDLNPETRSRWDYPDGPWDADRNTREFLAALPVYRAHGLRGVAFNLQGGSPKGYSKEQPWHNSTFEADGSMRPAYLHRLEQVLDRLDELGMIAILGLFYFGQDQRLADEQAVLRAVDNALDWLIQKRYTHVIIETANEIDVRRYDHDIIKPPRNHELIERIKRQSEGRVDNAIGRFLVGSSFCGGAIPTDNVIEASDLVLIHGNGVHEPAGITRMVEAVRAKPVYRGQPIVFNEDDHFDFDQPTNNMLAAIHAGAGWGYFDYRFEGEGYDEGYQSMPANWGISSERKRGFFSLLSKVTGVSSADA